MDLIKLFNDLKAFKKLTKEICFGHYSGVEKALDLLIKELDYLTIFER